MARCRLFKCTANLLVRFPEYKCCFRTFYGDMRCLVGAASFRSVTASKMSQLHTQIIHIFVFLKKYLKISKSSTTRRLEEKIKWIIFSSSKNSIKICSHVQIFEDWTKICLDEVKSLFFVINLILQINNFLDFSSF